MKHGINLLVVVVALLLGGCATKIDLYDYKDVSSVNVIDLNQADYQVKHPRLDENIIIENQADRSYSDFTRDAMLQANSRKRIFDLSDANATHTMRLMLYHLDHTRSYVPSVFIKTDKGGYYTKAYWSYEVSCSLGAELKAVKGNSDYFEASNRFSFTIQENRYNRRSGITRDKYQTVIRGAADRLMAKIGNAVAPEGLVISKKVNVDDEDDLIFLINMGRSEGISPEQTVYVYKNVVFKNEIDARTDESKVFIGRGTVSNQVSGHRSWIVMDDDDLNHKVDIGDIIRAQYR